MRRLTSFRHHYNVAGYLRILMLPNYNIRIMRYERDQFGSLETFPLPHLNPNKNMEAIEVTSLYVH